MMAYALQAGFRRGGGDLFEARSDASTPSPAMNRLGTRIGRETEQGPIRSGALYDWFRSECRMGPQVAPSQRAYLVCLNYTADIWHTFARSEATHDQGQCFLLTDFAGSRGVTSIDAWPELADRGLQCSAIVTEMLPDLGAGHFFETWLRTSLAEKGDEPIDLFVSTYPKHGIVVRKEVDSARPLTEYLVQALLQGVLPVGAEPLPSRDQATADYIAGEGMQTEVRSAMAKLGDMFPGALAEIELLPSEEGYEGPILAFRVHGENLERAEFRRQARAFHEWIRDVGFLKLYEVVSITRA